LPEGIGDAELEALLYQERWQEAGPSPLRGTRLAALHRELKRKHVTLSILWDEYIEQLPGRISLFAFLRALSLLGRQSSGVTMRQTHLGGEKEAVVDYDGDTVPVIVNRLTGETRPAQIFVAVMGASNLTYAAATWSQSLPDWIAAHTHAFEMIGGVPKLLVPDNTKVAVIKACRYDPQVNRTYAEMADITISASCRPGTKAPR